MYMLILIKIQLLIYLQILNPAMKVLDPILGTNGVKVLDDLSKNLPLKSFFPI